MNIGLILAGGNKDLDKQGIPVQYISIYDKPILIYTLETFQKHPQIDAVEIVCLEGWQDATKAFCKQFDITKLRWIAEGGRTGQESIRNGISYLNGKVSDEDIIIIHDGTRPMMDRDILTDVIRVAQKEGNAIAATNYSEQMFYVDPDNQEITNSFIDRDTIRNVTTPQAYRYIDLSNAYKKAFYEGIAVGRTSYADTMMVTLGNILHFAAGSGQNIKIETEEDIELFRSLLDESKAKWLK